MADKNQVEAVQLLRKASEPALAALYEFLASSDPARLAESAGKEHPVMKILDRIALDTFQHGVPVLFGFLSHTDKGKEALTKLAGLVQRMIEALSDSKPQVNGKERSGRNRKLTNQLGALGRLLDTIARALNLSKCGIPTEPWPAVAEWDCGKLAGGNKFQACSGKKERKAYDAVVFEGKKKGDDQEKDTLLDDLFSSVVSFDVSVSSAEAMFLVYYVYGLLNDLRSAPMLKLFRSLEVINKEVLLICRNDEMQSPSIDNAIGRLLKLSDAVRVSQQATARMCAQAPVLKYVIDFVNSHAARFDGRVRAYAKANVDADVEMIKKWPFLDRDFDARYTNVGSCSFYDFCSHHDVIPAGWTCTAGVDDQAEAAEAMMSLTSPFASASSSSSAEDAAGSDKTANKMLSMGRLMRKTAMQFLRDRGLEKPPAKKKRDREGPYQLGYNKGYGDRDKEVDAQVIEGIDIQDIMAFDNQDQDQELDNDEVEDEPAAKRARVVSPPAGKPIGKNDAVVMRMLKNQEEREERQRQLAKKAMGPHAQDSESSSSSSEDEDEEESRLTAAEESDSDL